MKYISGVLLLPFRLILTMIGTVLGAVSSVILVFVVLIKGALSFLGSFVILSKLYEMYSSGIWSNQHDWFMIAFGSGMILFASLIRLGAILLVALAEIMKMYGLSAYFEEFEEIE